jgi:hypothetical protein
MHWTSRFITGGLAVLWAVGLNLAAVGAATVEITVVDKKTGKPVPCRIHLMDRAGRPQRAGRLPFWRDHFSCPGAVRLDLPGGPYTYEVERGPEYALGKGAFTADDAAPVKVRLELERLADLSREGWWSGDLHVHRPVADMELLMRAEDLHVAPVITWWHNRKAWHRPERVPDQPLVRFDKDRYYHVLAGEDEREGGALLYFNLRRPLDMSGARAEYPSPLAFVAQARRHDKVWIDIEKPFWWDVPAWLASGQMDSMGLPT